MEWKSYVLPTLLATSATCWVISQVPQSVTNEIQHVSFTYNQAANENNWHQQPPTLTVDLSKGSPTVSYALVAEGKTPTSSDYITVSSTTLGYKSQYRYRNITRQTRYSVTSPGSEWKKSGNQKQEDYWKAVRTETGITPGDLPVGIDRYYALNSDGTYRKLTSKIEDIPATTISDTTIYRFEADGFYHSAPAYYANGQPVPILWQGKYTKSTPASSLYLDNYIRVQWNTNPNQTLYKYSQIWEAIPTDQYLPLYLGTGLNAHVESSPYRQADWWSNFNTLASKNNGVKLVGVDFKRTAYQRDKRTTYEWYKETDTGYVYTTNLTESQTKPAGTSHHEQTSVITQFQVKIPSTGKYRLYVKQSDGLGNNHTTTSSVIQVDNQVPTFTYTVSPTGVVNYTAQDRLSGIASVKLPSGTVSIPNTPGTSSHSGQVVLTQEGRYPFEVTDLAGNKQTYHVLYEKDYTAPTATHTLSPTTWTNQSVTIKVSASDPSGIMSIKLPNGQTTTASSASYTVYESGTYPFLITDQAGNGFTYSVVVSTIDKEKPTASLIPSTTNWTNQSLFLTATAKDTQSGVKTLSYRINGGAWTSTSNNAKITHTQEGTFRYQLQATDQAGNVVTTAEETVRLDKTAPTATHQLSTTAVTNQPVTITVNASDALSGVKEIQTPDGVKVKGSQATYRVAQNGTYRFRINDQAGNSLDYSVRVSNIDNGAPTLSLVVSNPEQWSRSKTIQVTASDTQGIQWIKLPNGNLVYQSSTTYTVTENNYYYFEAADAVGNITRNYIYVGKIDKEAPTFEMSNQKHNIWTNEDVGVNFNAKN